MIKTDRKQDPLLLFLKNTQYFFQQKALRQPEKHIQEVWYIATHIAKHCLLIPKFDLQSMSMFNLKNITERHSRGIRFFNSLYLVSQVMRIMGTPGHQIELIRGDKQKVQKLLNKMVKFGKHVNEVKEVFLQLRTSIQQSDKISEVEKTKMLELQRKYQHLKEKKKREKSLIQQQCLAIDNIKIQIKNCKTKIEQSKQIKEQLSDKIHQKQNVNKSIQLQLLSLQTENSSIQKQIVQQSSHLVNLKKQYQSQYNLLSDSLINNKNFELNQFKHHDSVLQEVYNNFCSIMKIIDEEKKDYLKIKIIRKELDRYKQQGVRLIETKNIMLKRVQQNQLTLNKLKQRFDQLNVLHRNSLQSHKQKINSINKDKEQLLLSINNFKTRRRQTLQLIDISYKKIIELRKQQCQVLKQTQQLFESGLEEAQQKERQSRQLVEIIFDQQ